MWRFLRKRNTFRGRIFKKNEMPAGKDMVIAGILRLTNG